MNDLYFKMKKEKYDALVNELEAAKRDLHTISKDRTNDFSKFIVKSMLVVFAIAIFGMALVHLSDLMSLPTSDFTSEFETCRQICKDSGGREAILVAKGCICYSLTEHHNQRENQ